MHLMMRSPNLTLAAVRLLSTLSETACEISRSLGLRLHHYIHNITDTTLNLWYSTREGIEERRSAVSVTMLIQSQFVSMSPMSSQGLREFLDE